MNNASHHLFDDTVVIPSLGKQLGLDLGIAANIADAKRPGAYFSAPEIDLSIYDRIILMFSAGKDSIACLLHLLDLGVPKSKIELWHHDVDGREGSTLMDWAFMADYNRKFAEAFGLPLYFSWLEGGFEGELNKENALSRPIKAEVPTTDGGIELLTLERDARRAKPASRLRFPQQGASLQTRWCSAMLKIDVARRAITAQDRLLNSRSLVVCGERRGESNNRAKYFQFEQHAADCRNGKKGRHVDVWRTALEMSEEDVWQKLKKHNVIAPVPYRLGWGRSSCMSCIFNSDRVWATIKHYFPESISPIAKYEDQFGTTISRNRINVIDLGNQAKPFEITDMEALEQARSREYHLPIFVPEGQKWVLPAGAFSGHDSGPT